MFSFVNQVQLSVSNDKIKQNERNAMRAQAMANLMNVIANAGYECGFTSEGIAINVPNEDLGAIPFIVDIKVKDLSYDVVGEVEDYAVAQEQKRAEAQAKAEAKAAKIKADREKRTAQAQAKANA